jgi:hypothetical protein
MGQYLCLVATDFQKSHILKIRLKTLCLDITYTHKSLSMLTLILSYRNYVMEAAYHYIGYQSGFVSQYISDYGRTATTCPLGSM